MEDVRPQLAFAHKLEKILGLAYIPGTSAEGSVCFAESEELRPEFKTTFTAQNLKDYLFAVKNFEHRFETGLLEKNADGPRFPKNAEVFWEMVDAGNKLRGKR